MSFNFGAPRPQQPTLGFASAPPTATSQPPPAFGSFSFGAGAAAPTSSASASFGTGIGGGGGLANPATSSTLGTGGFSFGQQQQQQQQPAQTGAATLNFGTSTTSTTPFGAGLFAKPLTSATATSTTAALGGAPPQPTFVGLGGADLSQSQQKPGDAKQDNIKVKETQVPEEIVKTVEAFKTHMKVQKTLASEIARTSTTKLTNVSTETKNLQWSLTEIANATEGIYMQIKLLRKETSNAMAAVEMAQRTRDTPPALQYENDAPFQYFVDLVSKFEQDLINLRQRIALTESHMHSLTNPQTVTPDDLKRGFKQINESFISLAGRLHEIHQQVEAQKEQYLNLRKYRLRDTSNVFAQLEAEDTKLNSSGVTTTGPTPFSTITAMSTLGRSFIPGNPTTAGGSHGVGASFGAPIIRP